MAIPISEEVKNTIYKHIIGPYDTAPFFEYLNSIQNPDPDDPEKYNEVSLERGINLAQRYAEYVSNKAIANISILYDHIIYLQSVLPEPVINKLKKYAGNLKTISQLTQEDIDNKLDNAAASIQSFQSWLYDVKESLSDIIETLELNNEITPQIREYFTRLSEDVDQRCYESEGWEKDITEIYHGKTEETQSVENLKLTWVNNKNIWTTISSAHILKEQANSAVKKLVEYQNIHLLFYSLYKKYPIGSAFPITQGNTDALVIDYLLNPETQVPGVKVVFPKGEIRELYLNDFIPLTEDDVFTSGGKDPRELERPEVIQEETEVNLSELNDLL